MSVRLDVWLDIACLFKTRSEAQKACRLGKVSVNGAPAKPHREVKVGDELVISRPLGRRQLVTVSGVADTHIPKADARQLYEPPRRRKNWRCGASSACIGRCRPPPTDPPATNAAPAAG